MSRGRRRSGAVAAAAAAVCAAASVPAPGAAQTFSGEVRPRLETRWAGSRSESFTSMRTRLGLEAELSVPGRVFVQLQDVRFWGEGSGPGDPSAEAFDLHQGYLEFGARGDSRLWVRIGRQEINLGSRRLVAAPPWSQASRSFDGARGTVRLAPGANLDLFVSQVAEDRADGGGDATFSGLWLEGAGGALRRGALFVLAEGEGRSLRKDRFTWGVEGRVAAGPVALQLEWAAQTSEGVDEAASLVAGRLEVPLSETGAVVSAGADRLSGALPGEDRRPFSRLYGLAHAFYGFADLFTGVESETAGRGLLDWTARVRWPVAETWSVQLDLHRFRVAEADGLGDAHLADEVDLVVRWAGPDGVTLLGGLSGVDDGPALSAVGRPGLGQWYGYLQLGTTF